MMLRDRVRWTPPDGEGVDPRNDQGHKYDVAERLEVTQKPEAERSHAEELAEVLRRAPAGDVKRPGQHAERDPHGRQAAPEPQRHDEPDEREARRNEDEPEEGDVPPVRRAPQPPVERVVEPERRAED